MRVAGLVLAGGRSRRMGGGHKFLLDLNGRSLASHVIARLEPQVDAIAFAANCDPVLLPGGYPVLPDRPPSRGPLSGLLAGLEWASTTAGASHVLTAAADTPLLPVDLHSRLATALAGGKAALAASGGRVHPTFGLWSVELLPSLSDFLDRATRSSVLDFASDCGATLADFPAEPADPFFNINEPADLETARRIATSG